MDSLENSLALCSGVTDDGSVEHLILDFFDLFRDGLAATLLFRHRTEQSAALSRENMPSGSAQDLLELPEASPPESSPSLETVVNLADARLSDVVLQPGSSLSSCSPIFTRHVETAHAHSARGEIMPNYAIIML